MILCTQSQSVSSATTESDWPLHGHGVAEQRHSPLKLINRENIDSLGLAFEFNQFKVRGRTHRGNEATPLAIDGKLYFTGPWSVVYAVDGSSGEVLWIYDPEVPGQWVRKACCDAVNRGVAISGKQLYIATLDGFLDAVNIDTGKRIWRVDTLIDRTKAYTITGAPRLAGGNIVIGNAGGELGVRGYISAYDENGQLAWRFYTVPGDSPDEHPEVTLARKTWSAQSLWEYGLGGTVWDSMVYDPDLNWIFVGVGNGTPWPAWQRSPGGGDNLFLSSILALDASNGQLQWHYQTTPADSWDYTATQHLILADIVIDARPRKVILQAPKNGFFYVLDRKTGELISARPYTKVSWADRVDGVSGRPVVNQSGDYSASVKLVQPSLFGGHNWQPMSFDPAIGLVFIPVLESNMSIKNSPVQYKTDSITIGASIVDTRVMKAADPFVGVRSLTPHSRLVAWDPILQHESWSSLEKIWWGGGVLSTAGGLVFQGSSDGKFWVYDSASGEVLRRIETGTAILAAPISYAINGVQYIAVLAGFGGAPKVYPPGSAPLKFKNQERLLVFRLGGGQVRLPPKIKESISHPQHLQIQFDLKLASRGRKLFIEHCARCHSERGAANAYPNLWNLPSALYDNLGPIVLEGSMAAAGMPAYSDLLNQQDVRAIREYLLHDEAAHGRP